MNIRENTKQPACNVRVASRCLATPWVAWLPNITKLPSCSNEEEGVLSVATYSCIFFL